jgi:predicted RNA-binding protein with PUA-like domain
VSHWLLKSEPSTFSFEDLKSSPKRRTRWDGVRNYQARNFIRDGMEKDDLAFFYHSSCPEPGIAGVVRIASAAYPDDTAFDPRSKHFDPASDSKNPRWYMVDVAYERALKKPITLRELKKYEDNSLAGLALLRRGNRLSVMPVSAAEWKFILSLETRA